MNIAKKQWMAPVATEIEVNSGAYNSLHENTASPANHS
jgi:hypothetical protein